MRKFVFCLALFSSSTFASTWAITEVCNKAPSPLLDEAFSGAQPKWHIFHKNALNSGQFPIQANRKQMLVDLLEHPWTTVETIGGGWSFDLREEIDKLGAIITPTWGIDDDAKCILVHTGRRTHIQNLRNRANDW